MPGASVRWRSGGHEEEVESDILRFDVVDQNGVIASAAATPISTGASRTGRAMLQTVRCCRGRAPPPPSSSRRVGSPRAPASVPTAAAAPGVLISAGFELWPTETFIDDVPDPRNKVHYDLISPPDPS